MAFAVPAVEIGILLFLLPFVLLHKFFLFITACWAYCGGESRSAAVTAHSSEVPEGIAMINIANLQHVEHSERSLEPSRETIRADVSMTDDEMSPLISRHIAPVAATVRTLQAQMQELNSRSLLMEELQQLRELLTRRDSQSQ
jgi:hypothetical protein